METYFQNWGLNNDKKILFTEKIKKKTAFLKKTVFL